jgi:AAA+ superfamily predicted ATPase
MKTGHAGMDRLATGVWIGQQAKDWYDKGREKYRNLTTWTVTLEESDTAYMTVQQWLLDTMPETKQKNVTAQTRTVYIGDDGSQTIGSSSLYDDEFPGSGRRGSTSETRVVLSLSQSHKQIIFVDHHKVQVHIATPQELHDLEGRVRRRSSSVKTGKIVFTCRSVEAQHAVVDMLNSMVASRSKRKPALWVADGWGNWNSQDAPQRKLESVILREGLKEDILADLRKFLDDETKYTELGIPWHRGYLFHGPPGTGKTSVIKAVAAELGLDLWYLPLADLKEDSSLIDLIRGVRARGVLLLEDVDAYQAARDREAEEGEEAKPKNPLAGGITNSALYNALDGVVTPHGLITIMTTNHIEKLDPALIRNGRADRVIELGLPTWSEISGLWDMFFPEQVGRLNPHETGTFPDQSISQAEISEVFKRNWEDPDLAVDELLLLCTKGLEALEAARS